MSIDLKKTRRQTANNRQVLDRLPPHSMEAEQGVLGCLFLDPNNCIDQCITILGSFGEFAFYDLRHQNIFESIRVLHNEQKPVDLISVQQWLKDRQLLDGVGGLTYLSELQDVVPSAANMAYYLDIVREKYLLRRMMQVCSGVVGKIYDFEGDVPALLDEVEKEIMAVSDSKETVTPPTTTEFLNKALNEIEAAWESQGAPTGLTTGLIDLDKVTDGLHGGEMIVIAARPSMGKTSLGMNIAEHVAISLHLPVGVFSLEMAGTQLTKRMLASVGRVNMREVQSGFMTAEHQPKIMAAATTISAAPIHIDDTAGLTILQLRARARRMAQQHGIKLFVIDYLQLLSSDNNSRNDNREREVSDISSGIKALAKELDVPVIVLAQLNREIEKERNRKPRLSDLRESGSIEQDADIVGLLYKPNLDDQPDSQEESDAGFPVNLLIAKQRNGPRDVVVKLTYMNIYTRFESQSPLAQAGVPYNEN